MKHPWLHRVFVGTVCVCVFRSIGYAQSDDRYAHPDGADYYGPRYEAKIVPTEVHEVLDDQGHYTIPSFIDLTIVDQAQDCWVVEQIPAPGTIVSCPQTVVVELKYTSDGVDERWARLPIEVIDATAPSIDVTFVSNTTPHTSFGGIQRYVVPSGGAAVVPIITITDSCDPDPDRELFLNGQPYQIGTPLTDVGLYILQVRTTDIYDNSQAEIFEFETRVRQSHTAVAVVQSTQCAISPDGQTGTFGATVLISDDEFDHHDILLSSVRLFLMGDDGRYLNPQAFAVAGGYIGECPIFQPLSADADINECWLQVHFEGTFVPDSTGCPVSLDILGVGTSGVGDLSFEWGARAMNVADATPVQTLLSLANKLEPCGQPQPPPPAPPPSCDAIETYLSNPSVCAPGGTPAPGAGCGPGSGSGASLSVWSGVPFNGSATATAYAVAGGNCGILTGTCGPIEGGSVLVMQFVGNCCNCAVTYSVGGASVGPTASATGTGDFWTYAYAAGTITIIPPCGPTSVAAMSAALVYSSNYNPPANPIAPVGFLTPPVNCIEIGCHTSAMFIVAEGLVLAQARSTNGGTANAKGSLNGNIQNINASPTFAECDPGICDP